MSNREDAMISVLFVCLGNICRSPAAEGVLRHLVEKDLPGTGIHIESCGLGDWHKGSLPDERMRQAAQNRGFTLVSRAQKIHPSFFDRFDLILVADLKVLNDLYHYAVTPAYKAKLHLITHYSPSYRDQEIPDPYYEGEAAFEHVLNMVEDSCQGLLDHLKNVPRQARL